LAKAADLRSICRACRKQGGHLEGKRIPLTWED